VRASLERIARAGRPVVVGALLGLAAGGIWTVVQPDRYRAEAKVLLRGGAVSSVMPAVDALAESSILEQNVRQTLHLSHTPHVSAKAGQGGVLTVSVEAGSRERARQIDAEAALVLIQRVATRFGTDPGVQATVLDAAHPVEQTSPTPERNLLMAGLIGLAVGIAGAVALARRRPLPLSALAGAVDPSIERRLRERVDAVAKRERTLARRAGELAGRESGLERRQTELAERQSRLERKETELAAAAVPEPEPEPEVREPAPLALEPVSETGRWRIEELERVVRERRDAFPDLAEDWETYLFLLRDHASIDGSLPRSFDPLIADVFGDALDR